MLPERARRTGFWTRRPLYQDGRAQCTAQENHGRLDQPATLQAPLFDWLECSDPAAAQGSDDNIRKAFTGAFVELNTRINLLLAPPIDKLDRLVLKKKLDEIGEVGLETKA